MVMTGVMRSMLNLMLKILMLPMQLMTAHDDDADGGSDYSGSDGDAGKHDRHMPWIWPAASWRDSSMKPEATIGHLEEVLANFQNGVGGDRWRCVHGSCWVPAANRPALTCVANIGVCRLFHLCRQQLI